EGFEVTRGVAGKMVDVVPLGLVAVGATWRGPYELFGPVAAGVLMSAIARQTGQQGQAQYADGLESLGCGCCVHP
ncbi:hypothetical protein, partial [Stutzerimonas nitrititolerans]|uniref:hypothetical protein n=1 Tax=Stutzerimonas nitrititolerans TaxID=2482751 RepID=UPI002898CE69